MTYQLQLSDAPYPFETGVVYKLTAPNDKEYVGQSVEYENRMKEHKRSCGGCRKLNASIKKYGFPNFNREILAENLMAGLELDSAEIYYISYHNTQSPNGLNLKSGGAGGRHSEESKQRMRQPRSAAHKANMSKARIGKKHSATHIANISKGRIGKNTGDDNPMKRWENRMIASLTKQLYRYEKTVTENGEVVEDTNDDENWNIGERQCDVDGEECESCQ